MNKTLKKVKDLPSKIFHFCCFGSSPDSYGFSHAYSRTATTQLNLIEPYFDDVMQPICDNFHVEMFVFWYFMCFTLLFSVVCQIPNLFQFAIDTFLSEMQSKLKKWNEMRENEKKLEQLIQHVSYDSIISTLNLGREIKTQATKHKNLSNEKWKRKKREKRCCSWNFVIFHFSFRYLFTLCERPLITSGNDDEMRYLRRWKPPKINWPAFFTAVAHFLCVFVMKVMRQFKIVPTKY